jgi:hypothetical protein
MSRWVARTLHFKAAYRGANQMLLGILLMAVWLIATGVLPFTKGRLPHSDTVMNVLAIVAGVLILLGR